MATDLEKALRRAKYTALPLPHGKTGPTTIIAFRSGQLYVVRNEGTCLKLEVTSDPSIETIQFTREFKFGLNAAVDLLAKLFGVGKAKGELDVRNVHSTTVLMGGLSHYTIQTGELVDYLVSLNDSSCRRDIMAADHLTIVAALRAESFRFTFKSAKGVTIKLSAEEATGLFQAGGGIDIEVVESGEVVVKAPVYVGVVTWDGRTMAKELAKAIRPAAKKAIRRPEPPDLMALAVVPDEIDVRRLASLGVRPGRATRSSKRTLSAASRKARTPRKGR